MNKDLVGEERKASMLSRVRNKEIDEFSKALARELADHFQAGQEKTSSMNKATKKFGAAVNRAWSKAFDFKQKHRLGIYGKARLANTFKWELREMGYEIDFVDELTKGLLINLNRK
ncbi:MAG TPA: hypothetical protein VGB36_15020 [Gammaproteobacteria bacterium]